MRRREITWRISPEAQKLAGDARRKGWHMGITGKGWGPGIANDANGKPRAITGKPFNQRKAKPPTSGISNNDYAANFADFLDAAPKDAPWCFWYGSLEPHRGYEYQSGVEQRRQEAHRHRPRARLLAG
jgi:hypothetical protein